MGVGDRRAVSLLILSFNDCSLIGVPCSMQPMPIKEM